MSIRPKRRLAGEPHAGAQATSATKSGTRGKLSGNTVGTHPPSPPLNGNTDPVEP
jgi:hypothetical protein